MCAFDGGGAGAGAGGGGGGGGDAGAAKVAPVTVHPARPKAVERMREKRAKYAPPHPRAAWPLCANILDPVRAAVVCRGAAEVLEALGWFAAGEAATGLRLCRVKNKFALPSEEVGPRRREGAGADPRPWFRTSPREGCLNIRCGCV
jgi:hypothetical protein